MVPRGGRGGASALTLPRGCPLELHCRRVGVYPHVWVVWFLFRREGEAGQPWEGRRGSAGQRPWGGGAAPSDGSGEGPVNMFPLDSEGRTNSLFLTFYFERTEDSHAGVRTDTDSCRVPSSTLPPADLLHGCRAAPHLDAGVGTTHACADPSTRALRV